MWLKEFFRDLLFKDPGAFTLYGTKPVTIYNYCKFAPVLTEDEKAQVLKDHPEARKRKYDFEKNYDKWIQSKNRFPIREYLFGSFPGSTPDEFDIVLFVNIEMTLRTLINHYENFRRVLSYDFDPFQVVFEVENRNSVFWNSVLKDHALTGILIGFGVDNSWFFKWSLEHAKEQNKKGAFLESLPSAFDTDEDIENYGPQHFNLPIFKLYGLHPDHGLVQQYTNEREKIYGLYKSEDEVDLALNWLTR